MAAGNYFETNFVDHHIIPQQFFSSSPLLQKLVTDFGASGFTVNSHLNLQSLPTDPAIARDMGVSVHNGGPLGSYQDEVGAKLNSIAETADGMAYLSGTADAATKARVLAQVAGFRDTMRVAIGNGELYTNAGSLNPGADPNFATALANEYNDSFFAKINGPNGIAGYLDQGNGSRRADFNLVVSNTGANVRWGLLNDKVAVRSLTHVVRRDPDGLIAVAFAAVGGKILYDLALKNGLDPFDPQDQPALFTKFTELGGQLSQSEFMSFISANLTDAAIGALTPGGLAKQAVNMLMSGEDALEVMKLAANAWPESSSAATLAEAAVALEATPAWERYKLYRDNINAVGDEFVKLLFEASQPPLSGDIPNPGLPYNPASAYVPCFAAGTRVLLADGTERHIEDIRIGDEVAAFLELKDGGRGPLRAARVRRLLPGITAEWVDLEIGNQVLRTTPNHQFMTESGRFAAARDLVSGQTRVVSADGTLVAVFGKLVSAADAGSGATWLETEPTSEGNSLVKGAPILGWRTYNFEVEKLHTYVAGGVRVHNDCLNTTDDYVHGSFNRNSDGSYTISVVDQSNAVSTITHSNTAVGNSPVLINRTTWLPDLPNVSIVNNWIVPDDVSPIVGVGRLTLNLGSQSFDFGDLSVIGATTFSQTSLPSGVPGISLTRVSWNNGIGQPLLTVDLNSNPVTNALLSATITDNANNFDWSRQDVREVFSNPGSSTSSGITVTSTQLDGGARVITLERDASTTSTDVNNDGVVDQEDADIIFGSGGDDISGGEGLDILEGGAGEDQLNADGSKTRYTVTGWQPEVTAGYTFNDVVNNFGEIKLFGADQVDLAAPILTGSQIGAVFGSTLSRFIAGDNVFAQIGTGAVLSTALSAVGAQFDKMFALGNGDMNAYNAITNRFETTQGLGETFAASVRSAGVGALTSYLSAELAEGLGIDSDSFGSQLFNFASSQVISKLSDFALANIGAGLNFTDGITGALFGTVQSVLDSSIFTSGNIGAFLGGYLARQLVDVENLGGAIGQAALGSIAGVAGIGFAATAAATLGPVALVAVPLVLAFGGTFIGTWLGNIIGSVFQDNTDCTHEFGFVSGGSGNLVKMADWSDDWSGLRAYSMVRDEAMKAVKQIVAATEGTIVANKTLAISVYAKPSQSTPSVAVKINGVEQARYYSTNPNTLFDIAVFRAFKNMTLTGGNDRAVSAIKNSDATTAAGISLRVNWALTYDDIVDQLEDFTAGAIYLGRTSFNTATGAVDQTAWRVARMLAADMNENNSSYVGVYVKNALTTTDAVNSAYLSSQLVIAKMFSDVVAAAKSAVGGSWLGITSANWDELGTVKQSTESSDAYRSRLMKKGPAAAIAAMKDKKAETKRQFIDHAVSVSSVDENVQLFINRLVAARGVEENLRGLLTPEATDDSEFAAALRQVFVASGVTISSFGNPSFSAFTFADPQPSELHPATLATWQANLKVDAYVAQAVRRGTFSGDQIVVDAIESSTSFTTKDLILQINVAAYASSLIGAYKQLISDVLAITTGSMGPMDFNTANWSGTTDADIRAGIVVEGTRLAQIGLSTAAMTGDSTLIASLRQNFDVYFRILGTFDSLVKSVADLLTEAGGSLVSRGQAHLTAAMVDLVKVKTGAELEEAILEVAKKLAFEAIKDSRFEGLDLYTRRMLLNSSATTLDGLLGEYSVVLSYREYGLNAKVIGALAARDDLIAAGWTPTLVLAQDDLRLGTVTSADFAEGFVSFANGLDLKSWGVSAAELAPVLVGNTLTIYDDPSGGLEKDLFVTDFVTTAGLTQLGSGSTTGTGANDFWVANAAGGSFADGTPTATQVSNDVLLGGNGSDTINGGAGSDYIHGGAGADNLSGGLGDDWLIGGAGSDTLLGGSGNDSYAVDSAGDVVTELATEGIDSVYTSVNGYVMSANVERMMMIGSALSASGNALANLVVGNAQNNTIDGAAGDDSIYGMVGSDALNGSDGNDHLFGGADADSLAGGAGDDLLVGGAGNDTMTGGAGSDTYSFGRAFGIDSIVNADSTASIDTIRFDDDIRSTDVWFAQSGNDLRISLLGGTDTISVSGWYGSTSSASRVDAIRAADGKRLDVAKVAELVTAMASFTDSNTGLAVSSVTQATLPSSVTLAVSSAWVSA